LLLANSRIARDVPHAWRHGNTHMSFEGFSMTTRLTFPASMFSVVCQRCGSTLRKNADSCPNCGADRAAAFGDERKKERAPERLGERLSLFKPAGEPAAESAVAVPSPSESAPVPASLPVRAATSAELGFELGPDPDVVPDSEGWTRRKTVIAGVCAFVLVAGGVAYMQHDSTDEDPAPSEQHSASGAIDAKDAKSSGYAQGGALPVTPAAPPVAAVERKPQVDERPMSVADTVLAARSAMEQHDLTAARNRVKSLTPPQQVRPDVQRLKDELAQRELERDAALQLARACEKTSAWACVQQNAGEALALDGSNTESQAMLERVIAHAGWLAGTPPLAKKKLAPDIASVAPPPVVTTPPPAPAVQAATPPATVAVAKPAPAPIPAPAPAPVTVQQKPAVAVAHAPAAAPTQTHTATAAPPPARESRRSATYARNTQTQTPATSTAKVAPAPAVAPPVQPATPPVTASIRSTTTPLATTTAAAPLPAPSAATLPAATTPPATTTTVRSTTPAPSYAAVPTPTPAVTRTAPAVATTATTTTTTTTTPPAATVTHTAAATYGASGATETRPATRASLSDGTNPDELERAIKQFGWSGGDTMPKPSR
jgi:hypothetical protein